jgi:putative transposase
VPATATKGELLRREGLYSSHIVEWRKARDAAARSGLAAGRRPKRSKDAVARQGDQEDRTSRIRPGQTQAGAGDLGKRSRAPGDACRERAGREQAEAVIDACFAELKPLVGTAGVPGFGQKPGHSLSAVSTEEVWPSPAPVDSGQCAE